MIGTDRQEEMTLRPGDSIHYEIPLTTVEEEPVIEKAITHKLSARDEEGNTTWFASVDGGKSYHECTEEPYDGDVLMFGTFIPMAVAYPRGFRILMLTHEEPVELASETPPPEEPQGPITTPQL